MYKEILQGPYKDQFGSVRTCKSNFNVREATLLATVHDCKGIDCRNSGVTWRARVDYRQTVSAGAVTGRQRESIPAGTGTTDLPRETERDRKRQRDREKERGEEENDVSRGRKERKREAMKSERYQEVEQRSNDTIEAGKGSRSQGYAEVRRDRPSSRYSYMEILLIHIVPFSSSADINILIIPLELRFKIEN